MRLFIGLLLGAAFLLAGLIALAGGADQMAQRGFSEGVGVAFGVGAVLMGLGVAIMVLSFKASARRKAARVAGRPAPVGDRGEVEGALMGFGMAHMMNSDDYGGDDDGD